VIYATYGCVIRVQVHVKVFQMQRPCRGISTQTKSRLFFDRHATLVGHSNATCITPVIVRDVESTCWPLSAFDAFGIVPLTRTRWHLLFLLVLRNAHLHSTGNCVVDVNIPRLEAFASCATTDRVLGAQFLSRVQASHNAMLSKTCQNPWKQCTPALLFL
jgi:hypothetical protein